jgi:nucleoside-diphosphate-sugar epimerase
MLYEKMNVLITGGLGFLGSNLAHKLLASKANVTIIDNLSTLYGGNEFNIYDIRNRLNIVVGDVRNENLLRPLVERADMIFHFAAQVSYIDSLSIPFDDLDINARSTLLLLELCRKYNPAAKILFSSSRLVLGRVYNCIFDEESSPHPLSLYGLHKFVSEKYLLMYFKNFGIKCTIFRITNPYGPRQQIKHNKYSLIGWFVRQAMEGQTIKIFGDGEQVRDYVFADDLVEAVYLCSMANESNGEVINVGSGTRTKFKNMVELVIETVGKGRVEKVPWPKNYETIETGDCVANISKLKKMTGFSPITTLEEGIRLTYNYYYKYMDYYI